MTITPFAPPAPVTSVSPLVVVTASIFPAENASNAARNFVAAQGFLCKDDGTHGTANKLPVNPFTKHNYRTDIENTIIADGFYPIPWGDAGGPATGTNSYCRVS